MANNRQFKHPIAQTNVDQNISLIAAEDVVRSTDTSPKVAVTVWNNFRIVIRSYISLQELQKLTEMILMQCWDGEQYLFEMFGYAIRKSVIQVYTNVSLPDDQELCHSLLYQTDLYKTVCEFINPDQLDDLEKAIQLYFK